MPSFSLFYLLWIMDLLLQEMHFLVPWSLWCSAFNSQHRNIPSKQLCLISPQKYGSKLYKMTRYNSLEFITSPWPKINTKFWILSTYTPVTCWGIFNVMPVSVLTDVNVTDTTRKGWGIYRDMDTSWRTWILAVELSLKRKITTFRNFEITFNIKSASGNKPNEKEADWPQQTVHSTDQCVFPLTRNPTGPHSYFITLPHKSGLG